MRRRTGVTGNGWLALALIAAPSLAWAEVKVQEKSKLEMTGAMGSIMRTFGGKAAREGVVDTKAVKGDRMMTRSEDTGQLIDLAEEKIYTIDFDKKSYRVMTFAEMRKMMKDAAEAAKSNPMLGGGQQQGEVDMEVDFQIDETGKKENIAGYDCKQVVTKITTRQKGKTLEKGGGVVVSLDQWLGPQIPEMKEFLDFHMRYAKKLALDGLLDPQAMMQMAQMMAANPMVKKAMAEMEKKKIDTSGTALRTNMVIETVAGTEAPAEGDGGEKPPSIGSMLGGLGKAFKKKGSDTEAGGDPNRSKLMGSRSETISITTAVEPADLAIPAGFKQKN